jgi:hypothetical protein
MLSKLRTIDKAIRTFAGLVLALGLVQQALASPSTVDDSGTAPRISKTGVESTLNLPDGHHLLLSYSFLKRTLRVANGNSETVVGRIEKGRNPELIGAEEYIRFLPGRLQPYLSQNKVLFLSAERSSAGDGGGYCGSGGEIYLNVLNLETTSVAVISRILISSCKENIELAGTELATPDYLSALSISNQQLRIRFLFFKNEGGKNSSVLSSDFKELVFDQ